MQSNMADDLDLHDEVFEYLKILPGHVWQGNFGMGSVFKISTFIWDILLLQKRSHWSPQNGNTTDSNTTDKMQFEK